MESWFLRGIVNFKLIQFLAQQFSLSGEAELLRKNQVFPTALTSLWIVQARFALRY